MDPAQPEQSFFCLSSSLLIFPGSRPSSAMLSEHLIPAVYTLCDPSAALLQCHVGPVSLTADAFTSSGPGLSKQGSGTVASLQKCDLRSRKITTCSDHTDTRLLEKTLHP